MCDVYAMLYRFLMMCAMQGWGTCVMAQGGIVLNLFYTHMSRPPILTALLILVTGALLMVTGMWLTLQFRFIQMQYPAVVLAFERQVLTASLPVAAIMQVRCVNPAPHKILAALLHWAGPLGIRGCLLPAAGATLEQHLPFHLP